MHREIDVKGDQINAELSSLCDDHQGNPDVKKKLKWTSN